MIDTIFQQNGNPAANSEWIWKHEIPRRSPNKHSMPFDKFAKTALKKPRVPGTKLGEIILDAISNF